MRTAPRSITGTWLIPAALIALSTVPVAAGTARLAELASGASITPDNARFFAAPAPIVMHIIAVSIYCVLGAFQFSPGFRRRNRRWHRAAGIVLVPLGLAAALSGLWMTQFYQMPPMDGTALYAIRLIVGTAMVASLVMAVMAVRRRDYTRHGAWMIRAYAIGIGAGTQVLTHLPWFLLVGTPGVASRTVMMAAGWGINILVAEYIIRRQPARRRSQVVLAA